MFKKLLEFLDLNPLDNEEKLFQNQGCILVVLLFIIAMMLLAGFFIIK